jgi:hypothetical protein
MYNVWYIRQRIEGGKYLVEVEVEIEKSDKEYFEIFECLSIIYTLADIHWETRRPPTTYKVIDKHHHILIDWKSRTPDRRKTHQTWFWYDCVDTYKFNKHMFDKPQLGNKT